MKFNIVFVCICIVSLNTLLYSQEALTDTSERPRLVVGIVVEQMRYDYLHRYWDKFGEGGFKRLIKEGVLCENANYNYSLTQSAPGHATIVTGAQPSVHGIIADEWYVRLKNELTGSTQDNEMKTVGGNYNAGLHSPKNLITSTFTDELRMSGYFQNKVLSISLDPNSAVLLSGHIANSAYWYDDNTGNWISSSYYMDSLPHWVTYFNDKEFSDFYLQREWNTLYPMGEYMASLHDGNDYEMGIKGYSTFSYKLAMISYAGRKRRDYSVLRYTPFGNTLTKDFAINAMANEDLGKDDVTDVLLISFAVSENIGDLYGPLSIEMEDVFLRLDKDIEHFLKYIDEQVGKKNTLLFLTAASGIAYVPQYLEDIKMPSGYFLPSKTVYLLEIYLRALYGPGEWVLKYTNRQIYLNRNLIEDSNIPIDEIQAKAALFLLQFNAIANVVTLSAFETANFTGGMFQKMHNSCSQERSGDIVVNLKPGWMEKNPNKVTEHNSPYTYDIHVPLLFYGWNISHKSITDFVDIADIAPTLSMLLGIPYPNGCSGKPIMQLVK